MNDLVSSQSLERPGHHSARWLKVAGVVVLVLGGLGSLAYHELRTSAIQSWLLSRYAAQLSYEIKPGPSASIAFPRGGPFDAQRGYPRLVDFRRRLESAGYTVAEQARQSAGMVRFVRWGVTPPYREPAVAGLVIRDYTGEPLYDARPRDALFATFDDVPPLIVSTLLFLENRELTNPTGPGSNPAIDWGRLGKASGLYVARGVGLPVRTEGGSTLAVQIEKYRHSQSGRTASPLDKLRQLTAASLRAYRDGPDSTASRREIVLDYLNTMPLAAAPGYGEVHGLGNGLRAWFDLDLDVVEDALKSPGASPGKAAAYKHVLALLYAVRAPTRYLVDDPALLEKKITAYGDLLLKAGVIDRELYRELRETPLIFGGRVDQPAIDFAARRAPTAIREEVRRILGVRSPYEMDRLHLEIDSTVDRDLQDAANRLFRRLGDKAFVDARGLRAEHLLLTGDPSHVVYSLLLFERTPAGNLLRVQADNLDRPFDINSGMKLDLGSTAKLRTLAHYLAVMESLHAALSPLDVEALDRRAAETRDRDPLTRWAAETLRKTPGLGLDAFLAQALDRTYPAHPWEAFFTGGGVHNFENFEPEDNRRILPVHEAFAHSTNLVFIRLLRDLVRYHEARLPYDAQAVLADPKHPERRRMLEEMADKESRQYLSRAYAKYQGLESSLVLKRLLGERVHSPRHVAIVFFAWHPGADGEALQRWSDAQGYPVPPEDVGKLEHAYGNPKLTLLDYGYLVGRHPLDLWVAGELSRTPALGWDELMSRSTGPRQLASNWLLEARAGLSLRAARALVRHGHRKLRRSPCRPRRADGHHRQRRRAPIPHLHPVPPLRHGHAIPHGVRAEGRRRGARDVGTGRPRPAQVARGSGGDRHRSSRRRCLPGSRREAHRGGREDGLRRQPLRHLRGPRAPHFLAPGEPHGRLRLLHRRPLLRHPHRLDHGEGFGPVPVHERAARDRAAVPCAGDQRPPLAQRGSADGHPRPDRPDAGGRQPIAAVRSRSPDSLSKTCHRVKPSP